MPMYKENLMKVRDIPEIAGLSTPEKILLLQDLWDDIAADDARVPVPDSHKIELRRRLEKHDAASGKLLSLAELKDTLLKTK